MTERAAQFDDGDATLAAGPPDPHADGGVGDLHLGTVVLNVQNMERAVAFWSAALGYRPRDRPWHPTFMMLVPRSGPGLPLSLQLTDHPPREPLRGHVDLYTHEQARHVERLVAVGASRVPGWPYPDDPDFVVLRDTEGNEFCVIDRTRSPLPPSEGAPS